jgi:hypothetical protein
MAQRYSLPMGRMHRLPISRRFQCQVAATETVYRTFVISGTFFCQQNAATSVCAHAAICMIINNMSTEGVEFVHPEDINGILDIDHRYKKLKYGQDFHKADFEKVFSSYGLSIEPIDFLEDKSEGYDTYIYKYVESRCPALVVFTTEDELVDHVVPVCGHTLNADMWTPEAKITYSKPETIFDIYQSTALWVDHFIIHDDNLGMYYCLPTYALKRLAPPDEEYTFRAKFGLAVIPAGVLTPSREAQWAAASVLHKLFKKFGDEGTEIDEWTRNLISSYEGTLSPRIVATRTFLITREEYADSLTKPDFEGNHFSFDNRQNLIHHLPDRFWLSEITLPDVYTANKSKIVDFCYPCDRPATDNTEDWDQRWIQIRLPGALLLNADEPLLVAMAVKSHYPLVRLEKGQPLLEW